MANYEYKTVNLYLTPIESEVSQMTIQDNCNEMGKQGWELVNYQIYNECYVMLIFKR